MYTECPISKLMHYGCYEIYSLLKRTFLAEFANFLPSQLLNELNIYFVYRDTIAKAEADFNKYTKDK